MDQALQHFNTDWAIEQIANGAFLKDLSAKTGIDKRRLSEQLRKHPDYKIAKECAIEVQLDNAQNDINNASDALDIARARERFKAAAWRAEREMPHRWSAQQTVTHEVGESFSALLEKVAAKRREALQQSQIVDVTPEGTVIRPQIEDML